MTTKTLTVETTKGTKTYNLSPTSQGFDVYRVEGFFGSKRNVGHGSNVESRERGPNRPARRGRLHRQVHETPWLTDSGSRWSIMV